MRIVLTAEQSSSVHAMSGTYGDLVSIDLNEDQIRSVLAGHMRKVRKSGRDKKLNPCRYCGAEIGVRERLKHEPRCNTELKGYIQWLGGDAHTRDKLNLYCFDMCSDFESRTKLRDLLLAIAERLSL